MKSTLKIFAFLAIIGLSSGLGFYYAKIQNPPSDNPPSQTIVYPKTNYARMIYSSNPDVQTYQHFITPEEAEYLIQIASKRLERSRVTNGANSKIEEGRTSSSAHFEKSEFEVIKKIEQRVCSLVNCSVDQIEPIQVVHYSKGQKYLNHHDYFDEIELETMKYQRIHTFLIYLNDIPREAGGATYFPILNLRIQPVQGTALYFRNVNEQGVVPATLHRGEEILLPDIEKWAINVWISDQPVPNLKG